MRMDTHILLSHWNPRQSVKHAPFFISHISKSTLSLTGIFSV